jgi:hypothetical protein
MTCCIVGLLILMAVGRIRRALGHGETTMLFAPVAQRPAPRLAETGPPATAQRPSAGLVDVDRGLRADSVAVFRYAAVGIALCLIAAPALVWSGAAVNTGSAAAWLLRSCLYLVIIVAAVGLGRSAVVLRAPRGAGSLLIVVGVIAFELGLIDMHVFGLFDFVGTNVLPDLVFHNAGPVLAMVGGLVLVYGAAGRRKTSHRSSRSTVSSARPWSSAVTVPSTPPGTR